MLAHVLAVESDALRMRRAATSTAEETAADSQEACSQVSGLDDTHETALDNTHD